MILNRSLTIEDKCELNAIRNEIMKMPCLKDSEKTTAIEELLCAVLDLYDADSIMGVARYRLDICRKLNEGRML